MINSILYFLSFGKFYSEDNKQKKDILIFDYSASDFLSSLINKNNFIYFFSRTEKFDISVFIFTFLQKGFKDFGKNYFFNFIRKFKPKFIISMWILNSHISELKKEFPEIKVIIIQSHRYTPNIISKIKKFSANTIDYLYVFREYDKKELNKIFPKSKITVVGSAKNNHFNNLNKKKKNKILYFSEYKISRITYNENVTLDILNKFCLSNNVKFDIQFRYQKIPKEYLNFLNKKNLKALDTILFKSETGSSYKNSNDYEYLVSHSSTLVDEFLSNFKKLIVLESYDNFDKEVYKTLNHGKDPSLGNLNPMYKETKPGYFWTKYLDEKNVFSLLNNLLNFSTEEYNQVVSNYLNRVFYDQNNKILTSELLRVGIPVKKNDNN